jgi:hypothetical protein
VVNIEMVLRARFEMEKGIFGITVHLIFLRWMDFEGQRPGSHMLTELFQRSWEADER